MDEVLRLLEARRWDKYCRRTNIATPDLIEGDAFKRARLQSNKIRPNEHKLLEAIKAIAPEWHENTEVILNRDVQCKRHTDGARPLVDPMARRLRWRRVVLRRRTPHRGHEYVALLQRPGLSLERAAHRPQVQRGAVQAHARVLRAADRAAAQGSDFVHLLRLAGSRPGEAGERPALLIRLHLKGDVAAAPAEPAAAGEAREDREHL